MLSTIIIIVMHYLQDTQQKITQQQQQQQNKEPRYHGDSPTECQQCAPQSYGHMIMTWWSHQNECLQAFNGLGETKSY